MVKTWKEGGWWYPVAVVEDWEETETGENGVE
jgi:hypothetical protein